MKPAAFLIVLLVTAAPLPSAARAFQVPDPTKRVKVTTVGPSDNRHDEITATDDSCPAQPTDGALRQRLVDVAVEEWKRFGFPVTDYLSSGKRTIVKPPEGDIVSDKLNPPKIGIVRRSYRLGRMEDDKGVPRAAIGGYWTAVPGAPPFEAQNKIWANANDAGWAEAWSAAFISYVVCASGVGEQAQFKRSGSHWRYVDQAIDSTLVVDPVETPRTIFKARNLSKGLPEVGDLLCAYRNDGAPAKTIEDRKKFTDDTKAYNLAHPDDKRSLSKDMHCDLVVKVDKAHGYVALIGGNVVQATTMTLVRISKTPSGMTIENDMSVGARPWFAVLALQSGGTASLDKAPALANLK